MRDAEQNPRMSRFHVVGAGLHRGGIAADCRRGLSKCAEAEASGDDQGHESEVRFVEHG